MRILVGVLAKGVNRPVCEVTEVKIHDMQLWNALRNLVDDPLFCA
jgi:hypothetical protein